MDGKDNSCIERVLDIIYLSAAYGMLLFVAPYIVRGGAVW